MEKIFGEKKRRMGEVVVSSEEGSRMRMELGTRRTQVEKEVTAKGAERKMENNNNKEKNDDSASVTAGDACSSFVRWESFLPKMVLRVLLVEADDSTRQIIAALLRKCNYKGNCCVHLIILHRLNWFCEKNTDYCFGY